jgi:serine/threonine protein kinase
MELFRRADGSLWELGRGAMGITYKAYDANLHCTVALKVINTARIDGDAARQRFLREARAAAALRHPNVASVFKLGTDQDHCFYVMEFVEGETLEARVSRRGPLPPAEALRLALQVARALAAAAKKQLVYRDLKPANLMLIDQDGEPVVKVIDFGLVKGVAGQSDESSWLTIGGEFVGTPYYASPEQVEGGEVDTRSDLYSLGATLYFLLTGRPPFSGSPGQVLSQHLYKPVPMEPLAGTPGCVVALVQHLMEKDPRQRPQTTRAAQEALLECLEQVRDPATGLEPASAPEGTLSTGEGLAQDYRLLEELGDSPQGRQFLAEDLRRQRRASLLLLSQEFASDGLPLAALKDAVERVRQAPHRLLREVYGLEMIQGDNVLVEEHAGGPSLLDVLRCRGALSAPEVVRLVNCLAPLVDHARAHRLEHVELTLPGIHLTDPGATGSETQTANLRQPLTAWPGLELKVNAIDFSFSCPPTDGDAAAAATQVGNAIPGDPRGSYVRLLGLLAYEALGGPRARVEATGRYAPVAALGEEANEVLRRALADGWPSAGELAQQLAASVGDAGPRAPVPEGDAASEAPEPLPQAVPANALKNRPLREHRALHWAMALGLVVLVGLGGHAWHRADRRPRRPATGAQAQWTPTPGPSSPASPAAAATTPVWDTVLPAAGDDIQPAPSLGQTNWVAAEQPAPSPIQSAPQVATGPAAPAPSAALAMRDVTVPPAAPSPTPSPAETPIETKPVPEEGTDATPGAAVPQAPPASHSPVPNDASAPEQEGGTATPDKVPEGGSEQPPETPEVIRAQQDDSPAALTPPALRPKTLGTHSYKPRPPGRPQPPLTFWQRLFGHKEPKTAKPGKPRQ